MKRIILITGGERSGKSTFAEDLALKMSPNPIYMATAHPWDDEFCERIQRHQERRGEQWTNIEEERFLSNHNVEGRVVLIDCLTLWATNYFFANEGKNVEQVLGELKDELARFTGQDATFIFVTNEIGMGGFSANAVQLRFTDLMGWLNQHVASLADEVMLMVSGIAMRIKN